jgi:hypothetical protein
MLATARKTKMTTFRCLNEKAMSMAHWSCASVRMSIALTEIPMPRAGGGGAGPGGALRPIGLGLLRSSGRSLVVHP